MTSGSGPSHDDRASAASTSLGESRENLLEPVRSTSAPHRTAPIVDRYRLGRLLGAGAMGEVWSAHDPELRRDVAIKILATATSRRRDRMESLQRLRREARALAALSHPNVVQVYDVVVDANESVYVIMELVDGPALVDWLRVETRSLDSILDAFVQAGRGLAAAHDAGLVHRDFKPGNVLVGRDGRVRVGDFGLARALDPSASTPEPHVVARELADTNDGALTKTGVVLGTPLYVAPEQLEGANADAQSDQYAFCIALYEAVFRTRPFPGDLTAIAVAKLEGTARPPPPRRGVPRSIEAIVMRGLARSPADRWPRMGELVDALARARSRGPRRVLWAGVAIAAVGVGFAAMRRDSDECTSGAAVDDMWNADARAAVAASLRDRPFAAMRVDMRLSDYESALGRAAVDVCGLPPTTRASSTQCLELARSRFDAAVVVLREGGRDVVGGAETLVSDLPEPHRCLDPTLAAREAPAELRGRVTELATELARAETLLVIDRHNAALAAAEGVRADIEQHGYDLPALVLQSDEIAGVALVELGEYDRGTAILSEAYFAAIASGDSDVAYRSAYFLAACSLERRRVVDAEAWLRHAEVATERTQPPPSARASLANLRGMVLASGGDLPGAEAAFQAGLDACDETGCRLTRSALSTNLAEIADHLGDHERAAALHSDALEEIEELFGTDSSATIEVRLELVEALLSAGRLDAADEQLRIATELADRWLDPDTDTVVFLQLLSMRSAAAKGDIDGALAIGRRYLERFDASPGSITLRRAGLVQDYANYVGDRGRLAEALVLYERALSMMHAIATDSFEEATLRLSRGYTLGLLGRFDEAIAEARAGRAILVARGAGEHPIIVTALTNEAHAERRAGRPERALALAERALAMAEQATARDDVDIAPAFELSLDLLALGRVADARARLEDLLVRIPNESFTRARTEFALARAIVGDERTRALALARAARDRLRRDGIVVDETTPDVVSDWIATVEARR